VLLLAKRGKKQGGKGENTAQHRDVATIRLHHPRTNTNPGDMTPTTQDYSAGSIDGLNPG